MTSFLSSSLDLLTILYQENNVLTFDHGIEHIEAVLNNTRKSLMLEDINEFEDSKKLLIRSSLEEDIKVSPNYPSLNEMELLSIQLAAILHDADDSKLFKTKNYENAKKILKEIEFPVEYQGLVMEMIELVSCSKQAQFEAIPLDSLWKLIPRDADRLEAIGKIGIERLISYNIESKGALITESTFLPMTVQELISGIDPERFESYKRGIKSKSLVDHIHDKLLHIHKLDSGNKILEKIAQARQDSLIEFTVELSIIIKNEGEEKANEFLNSKLENR